MKVNKISTSLLNPLGGDVLERRDFRWGARFRWLLRRYQNMCFQKPLFFHWDIFSTRRPKKSSKEYMARKTPIQAHDTSKMTPKRPLRPPPKRSETTPWPERLGRGSGSPNPYKTNEKPPPETCGARRTESATLVQRRALAFACILRCFILWPAAYAQ